MKTYVEKTLIKIQEWAHNADLLLDCDVYYDTKADGRGVFVVKLDLDTPFEGVEGIKFFESGSIRKSLKMALNWLEDYERDHLQGD